MINGFVEGERRLIIEIFRQAIDDILLYPHPNLSHYSRYPMHSLGYNAVEAMLFINSVNPAFNYYCTLLGIDPQYAERKIYKLINRNIYMPRASRKKNYQ
jgi:hypothetical protein